MNVKVKAIATGFRGGRLYREGEIFYVAPGSKSKWYIPVEARAAKPDIDLKRREPNSNPLVGGGPAPDADANPDDVSDLV